MPNRRRCANSTPACQSERDNRAIGLLEVTDRVAAFDWTLPEVMDEHLELNRQMNEILKALDPVPGKRRAVATA